MKAQNSNLDASANVENKNLGNAESVRAQLAEKVAELELLKAQEKELKKAEKEAQRNADKAAAEAKKASDKEAGIEPEKKEKAPAKPKVDVLALALNAIMAVEGVDDETKKLFHDAVLLAMPKSETTDDKKVEGPGVIKSIIKIIVASGPEGISKTDILKELVVLFPERDQFGMVSTIRAQLIPSRIEKDKHPVKMLTNGNFVGIVTE